MFTKYFISTLVFIIVSLVLLFQGEIKEGFHHPNHNTMGISKIGLSPDVNNKNSSGNGLFPKTGQQGIGFGQQFIQVEYAPLIDKNGVPIKPVDRKIGFDKTRYVSPASTNKIYKFSNTPVDKITTKLHKKNNHVDREASRNMQSLVSGPSRFQTTTAKLNHTYPAPLSKSASNPLHPMNGIKSTTVSAGGQIQQLGPSNRSRVVGGQYQGHSGGSKEHFSQFEDELLKVENDILKVDNEILKDIRQTYDDNQVPLPGGTGGTGGTGGRVSIAGQPSQPIIIDRLPMQALAVNSKSRNLYGADFIRGDLMIIPDLYMSDGDCEHQSYKEKEFSKHFQVSVKPRRDLRSRAIASSSDARAERALAEASLYSREFSSGGTTATTTSPFSTRSPSSSVILMSFPVTGAAIT